MESEEEFRRYTKREMDEIKYLAGKISAVVDNETQDKILGALVLVASATIAVGARRKDLPPYEELCEDFVLMLEENVKEMVKTELFGTYDN